MPTSMALLQGRYEYVEELGRGGAGRVMACIDRNAADRAVALKVVSAERVGALCWEFDRLCGLRSAQLVEALQLSVLREAAPAPFALPKGAGLLVEARVAASDAWAALDARRRISPHALLSALYAFAHGALEGLSVLHDAGFVHRDIKPDNLPIDHDGKAVVVDLELAAPVGHVHVASGTPAYLAPEAFAGVVTPQLDVFALGASLYDLLLGEPPAGASTHRASHTPWCERPLEALPAFVPPEVRALLGRWLGVELDERTADAAAALAQLNAHAEAFGASAVSPMRWATGRVVERAASPHALAWRGDEAARRELTERLRQGGVVQVVGPRGAGRSRLVREAVRDLQLSSARRGRPVPAYTPSSAAAATPDECQVLHVAPAGPGDSGWALASCRAEQLDGTYQAVVLEVEHATEEAPAVEVPRLTRGQAGELLGEALGEVAGNVVDAALEACNGFAGRLCAVLSAGLAEGRDMGRSDAWGPWKHAGEFAGLTVAQIAWLEVWSLSEHVVDPFVMGEGVLGASAARALARWLGARGWLRAKGVGVTLHPAAARAVRAGVDEAARERVRTRLEAEDPDLLARCPWLLQGEARTTGLLARAEELRRSGETYEAIAWLEEACGAVDDVRLVHALVDALRAQGRYGQALSLLGGRTDEESAWWTGELARLLGDRERARETYTRLSAAAGASSVRAEVCLVRMALDAGDLAEARERLGRLHVSELDPEAALRALEVRARLERGPKLEQALAALWDRAWRAGSLRWQGRALSLRAATRDPGDSRAEADWLQAYNLARQVGEVHEVASYAVNLGLSRLDAGDLGGAVAMLREGARRFAALDRPQELGRVLFNWANAWLLLGDTELAAHVLEQAERHSERAGDAAAGALCVVLRAELAMRAGLPRRAAKLLEQGQVKAPRHVDTLLAARLAFTLASLERAPEARRVLAALDAPAQEYRVERELAAARVALAEADAQSAEAVVVPLLSSLEREGSFEERVRALLLAAEVARFGGDAGIAAQRLGKCRELLDRAMRGLSTEQQASLRRVEHYARALEATPPAAARSDVLPIAWQRLVGAVPRLFRARSVDGVGQALCEVALELVTAERALWMVQDEAGRTRVGAYSPSEMAELEPHSASIVAQAWGSGETVSALDATHEPRWDGVRSVRELALRSVVAIPLRAAGLRGLLYVEDRLRPAAFHHEDVTCLRELVRAAEAACYVADQRDRERRARRAAERQAQQLSAQLEQQSTRRPGPELVGSSVALETCLRLADRVARSDLPALICGESGTGKELIARRIHAQSDRAQAAFVAENCAALPEPLLESALFGHVRGAFTGASRDHAGLFAQADGGTLFLDEIGEMSPAMQAKLLRVLETGEVRPVGGQRIQQVQVRLVAATHRDLSAQVREGRFREDLYYRVAVVEVRVPPLRERTEDIAELARHFVDRHAGSRAVILTPGALEALRQREWRGNVRELENCVRRALVMADSRIEAEHVEGGVTSSSSPPDELDLHAQVEALQRRLIDRALSRTSGNQTRAAELLGLSRYGLQKMLKRLAR